MCLDLATFEEVKATIVGTERGDDVLGGDNPLGPPHTDAFDICNGQQDTDLALPGSCEREISIEGDFVPPED